MWRLQRGGEKDGRANAGVRRLGCGRRSLCSPEGLGGNSKSRCSTSSFFLACATRTEEPSLRRLGSEPFLSSAALQYMRSAGLNTHGPLSSWCCWVLLLASEKRQCTKNQNKSTRCLFGFELLNLSHLFLPLTYVAAKQSNCLALSFLSPPLSAPSLLSASVRSAAQRGPLNGA